MTAAVGDLARTGVPEPEIARRLGLPIDLVRQVMDHLARTGKLVPLALGKACSQTACAGCFFAGGCSARRS